MAAVLITKEVRPVDEAGHRGVDSNDDFVTIQENYQDSQRLKFQPDLEEFRVQANALSEDVNNKSTIASDSAVTATSKASEAVSARNDAETFKDEAEAAVAALPEGTINDLLIAPDKAWSSTKINTDLETKVNKSDAVITGSIKETKAVIASSNIDLDLAGVFTKTITTDTTFTVSNPIPSGGVNSFILELTDGGSSIITWWSGVKWADGEAPELTVSGVDILGFYSYDGGVTWRGVIMALDSK